MQGTILEEIKQVKLAEGRGSENGLSGGHPSDQQSGDKTALMGVPLQRHPLGSASAPYNKQLRLWMDGNIIYSCKYLSEMSIICKRNAVEV